MTLHAVQPKELVVYAKETQTKEVEPEGTNPILTFKLGRILMEHI